MRTGFRDVVAGLLGVLVVLSGGCGGAPEPPEPSASPAQPEAPSPNQPSDARSPAPEPDAGSPPTASQAILTWDEGDQDRAIDLLIEAVESGDAELRILPVVSEAEFAKLSQSARDAIMPRMLQMDKAWTQLSRAMLMQAGTLDQQGDAHEASRLIAAVRAVALANSGDDVVLLYRTRNQAILKRL